MVTTNHYRPSVFVSASAALHLLALGSIAIKPAVWPFVLGGLVADHAGLVLGGLLPRCRILGPNITRLDGRDSQPRAVSLTFDDGPNPKLTPRILDVLDAHDVKASFFCVGRLVEEHRSLVREIAERGHRVENHTWNHPNYFAFLPPPCLEAQIFRTQSIIDQVTGRTPKYFRAPAGIRSPWLDPVLHRLRLCLVSWTRRGFDTFEKDQTKIYRRLVKDLAPGDILLLHDGRARNSDREPAALLDVVHRVLDEIQNKGLKAVPLD